MNSPEELQNTQPQDLHALIDDLVSNPENLQQETIDKGDTIPPPPTTLSSDLWSQIVVEPETKQAQTIVNPTAKAKDKGLQEKLAPALQPEPGDAPSHEAVLEGDQSPGFSVASRQARFGGPNALPLAVEDTVDPKKDVDSIAFSLAAFANLQPGQTGILRISIRSNPDFKERARAWLQATRLGQNPDAKTGIIGKTWQWISYLGSRIVFSIRQSRHRRRRLEPPVPPHRRGEGLKPIPASQASPDEKAAWKAAEQKVRDTAHFETLIRTLVIGGPEEDPDCERLAEESMAGMEMFDSDHGIQKITWGNASSYDTLIGFMPARVPEDLPMVLSAEELGAIAHLPDDQTHPHGVSVEHSYFRTMPMPNPIIVEDEYNPPQGIIPIGIQNPNSEDAINIGIRNKDLDRHMLLVGKTGSGKSELMKWLVFGTVKADYPIVLVDPHGQLSDDVLKALIVNCPERLDDIIYCDLSDSEYPVAFNPLDIHARHLIEPTVNSVVQMLSANLNLDASSSPRATMFAKAAITALCEANLILEDEKTKCTLLDILDFFNDEKFRQIVVHFAENLAVKSNFDYDHGPFEKMGERERSNIAMPITRAFSMLASSDAFSAVFSAPKNKLNLGRLVNNNSIVLIKLARFSHQAQLGEFVGSLIVPWLLSSMDDWGRKRDEVTGEERGSGCRIFVDESPKVFRGDSSVPDLLAEARKWDLGLIMAAQFLEQFPKQIIEAAINNTGSKIGLACDPKAAGEISRAVSGGSKEVTESDFAQMPNFHFYGNVQMPGDDGSLGASGPFSAKCLYILDSDMTPEHIKMRDAVVARSRELICSSIEEVKPSANMQRMDNVKTTLATRLKDAPLTNVMTEPASGGFSTEGEFDWN